VELETRQAQPAKMASWSSANGGAFFLCRSFRAFLERHGGPAGGSGRMEWWVSVSIRSESEKIRNRHLNRYLVEAGKAGGLEISGACEGNLTLVISLVS
jgi:hypothetical protein